MKIVTSIALVVLSLSGTFTFAQKKWTLEECVSYSLENNISIKNNLLDNKLTEIDKKDAFGSFLPSVNASASHSWNIGLNQNITTGLLENQTTQFTSMGASVGVDIYKGLQNQNNFRRAQLAIISNQYRQLKLEEDVALNVVNAYLQILFNKENLKVQKQQFQTDSLQLNRAEQMVKAGMLPSGDLFDLKATIATGKQRIVQAEYALVVSKLSLAQLMQLDDFQNFDISDVNYDLPASSVLLQSPASIFDKAKTERTEIKIAEADVKVAEKSIDIAKGALYPRLSGFYSFSSRISYADVPDGMGGVTSPPSFLDQFDLYKGHNFGLQLNVPIFNGFAARNNIERAKVNLEKSKVAYQQSELDLERNIYAAYSDAQGALQTYDAAESTLLARKEAFRYATERYQNGMINSFDYNQAQTLFVNAQSEVLRTKYDYIFRTKILEFYFGIPIIKK